MTIDLLEFLTLVLEELLYGLQFMNYFQTKKQSIGNRPCAGLGFIVELNSTLLPIG